MATDGDDSDDTCVKSVDANIPIKDFLLKAGYFKVLDLYIPSLKSGIYGLALGWKMGENGVKLHLLHSKFMKRKGITPTLLF